MSYIFQNNILREQHARMTGTCISFPGIAFSAYQSTSNNIGAGNTIIFDQTRINMGNGYNVNTGQFVTPVNGTYFFSLVSTFGYISV